MASAGNWFETERKAFKLRTKVVNTATYTARTGGASDNFIIDRVIQVNTTSGINVTITVPNGVYPGQQLLIECTANGGGTDTIDTTVIAPGDPITQRDAVGEWSILMWVDDTNGWVQMALGN